MISYSEREGRYEWSVEVQQALAFAVQCIGLRHASALHPGPEEGEGEDMGDDLSCYCCHVGSQGLLPVCSACMHLVGNVHCCALHLQARGLVCCSAWHSSQASCRRASR